MAAPALYAASVPVFLHYLKQAGLIVERVRERPDVLGERLAPDMFTAGQQFASAAEFALRGTFPLAALDVPDFPDAGMDPTGLRRRFTFVNQQLLDLDRAAFEDAETRMVSHRAGFAELEQTGRDYLTLFALPNFFFHLSMGFAVLRREGVEIGKSDFDGQHDYPPGFRF